jgi:hypothetical protein
MLLPGGFEDSVTNQLVVSFAMIPTQVNAQSWVSGKHPLGLIDAAYRLQGSPPSHHLYRCLALLEDRPTSRL